MKNNKFVDVLQEKLVNFSTKVSSNIYVLAIRDGMLAYVPFTFIASIFLILGCLPSQSATDFISGVIHVKAEIWQSKVLLVYNASLAIGGLLVLIAMAKTMAEHLKLNMIQVILTSVVAYLIIVPMVNTEAGAAISLSSISAQSMFCSIVTAMLVAKIYKFVDDKGIKIKMPSAVPSAVSAPFESLIPSFVAIIFFFVIRLIMDAMGTDAVLLINSTIGLPLTLIGATLLGAIFIGIFQQLLWFFGLHGGSIVSGVMTPVWQVLEDQNKAASMAGQVPPNIFSYSFFTHFGGVGVVGAVIAALIIARSKHYREISKIAAVPYIFNIGEPTLFGFPIMMNFNLLIPFIGASTVSTIISYIGFWSGLVPIPMGLVQVPWTTPTLLSGFLVTGSIKGSILQLVCIVVATLIWMPFIKIADKQNLKVETEGEAEVS